MLLHREPSTGQKDQGNTAAAQKAARYCLAKLEMTDAFSQNMAFRNAQSLLTKSEGTSLR